MATTNIRLSDDELRWLQKRAAAEGVSMNDFIRKSFKVVREMLDMQSSGGRVIFEDAQGAQTTIRFIL